MPLDPSPLVVAPIAGYRHERPALSAGIGGKVLVAHHEFDDASDRRVQRVHAHLLSDPVAPPADAGVTPVDAAATGPDANTGAPDWAGQADGPGPRADAGVTDDAGAADTQGARDGAERADAGASADGGTVPDGASPLDGATAPPGADASVTDLAAPSADATHDTSAEGPGGGTSCDCRLSGRPGSGSASLAFVALAFLTRLRRRRKEIP